MKAPRSVAATLTLLALAPAASAYLYFGAPGVPYRWASFPIVYRIVPRGIAGVSAEQLRGVVGEALA